ncbi:MAG: ABC transporter ATP-binding protein [Planctomycetes bacterium]|nr:ABC transporter ATP-binding protein [Planctomycetota bacterium]
MKCCSTNDREPGKSPERGNSVLLEVTDVKKTYRDRQGQAVPALQGVSLGVAKGEFVAISGGSGCGKTTLMNVLGCLDSADAGSYRFEAEDVGSWPERKRAELRNRRIGFVFQSFHLLPFLTVRENIELPFLYSHQAERRSAAKIDELLASVGLEGMAGRYPTELSGGQQQRVAIARALVMGADLILADEPTGNLDAAMAQGVLDVFAELVRQGKTVVLVTHDPAIAARAYRRIQMEKGRIVSDIKERKEALV